MRTLVALALAVAGCADERDPMRDGASGVHATGYVELHAADLAARGWDLALCASCHGDNFAGGKAGVSCNSCHEDTPTACDTCHEAQPTTGAHANHTGAVECAACHRVPARWDDPGHLDPAPADVIMEGLAAVTIDPADRPGPPAYAGGTCQNVYCHGAVLGPAGGVNTAPTWAPAPSPAACDRCHGAPPPTHATSDCATCHPQGARHVDGAIDVGRGPLGGCSGCHGNATNEAPPADLDGDQLTTALGVGAHQAHLLGTHRIAAPVACGACHAVPATVTAAGHIDSAQPAEVLATLGWDRATATCSSAACHGTGRPTWTATGEVFCGSCHALPPATAAHTPDMPLTACAGCHPNTVDGFGNILVVDGPTGPTSAHIDGDIDAP